MNDFNVEVEDDLATAGDLTNFDRPHDDYDVEDDEHEMGDEAFDIPPQVVQYLRNFQSGVSRGMTNEIQQCYETTFSRLTEKYYKGSAWPHAAEMSEVVNHDPVFIILYNELYYRHLYSKLNPSMDQRLGSWKNYLQLFALLSGKELSSQAAPLKDTGLIKTPSLELPIQWLWDIVDEFIYQFQNFCQIRTNVKNLSAEDIKLLKENGDMWDVFGVLRCLHQVAVCSGINKTLDEERSSGKPLINKQTGKMIGYFCLIGMLRVHCMLGDYHTGLMELQHLDFQKKAPLFTRVTACHITVYYYMGFAYMMTRRYADAIKCFTHILLYISRIKQYQNRSYQFDQIVKRNEQMYALLAICIGLCPQRIEEVVRDNLMDKHSDKLKQLEKGEDASAAIFEELFGFAAPKFVIISPPNYEDSSSNPTPLDAYNLQLQLFLKDVQQQEKHPLIRSYLQLYTTISVEKLAGFVKMQSSEFRQLLLSLKHKTRNAVRPFFAPPLSGDRILNTDIDFCLEGNIVHISDTKHVAPYGEFFIRHITKFEEVIADLESR